MFFIFPDGVGVYRRAGPYFSPVFFRGKARFHKVTFVFVSLVCCKNSSLNYRLFFFFIVFRAKSSRAKYVLVLGCLTSSCKSVFMRQLESCGRAERGRRPEEARVRRSDKLSVVGARDGERTGRTGRERENRPCVGLAFLLHLVASAGPPHLFFCFLSGVLRPSTCYRTYFDLHSSSHIQGIIQLQQCKA